MNPEICRSFSKNPVFFNLGKKNMVFIKKTGFLEKTLKLDMMIPCDTL